MAFPKKKKKVESDILKWLRESREEEYKRIAKNQKRSPYSTVEEKEKLEELKEKYGIKEQREQS